jgi:hypothetical protein
LPLLTLIVLGEVKVKALVNSDIKFPTKLLCIGLKKYIYSCGNILGILSNFRQYAKKFHFDVHFDVFSSKIWSWHNPAEPSSPWLVFTAITDHPRVGEVLPGHGSQSSASPVNIPVSFLS